MLKPENQDQDLAAIDLNTISVLIPKSKDGDDRAREQLLEAIQDYLLRYADAQLDPKLAQKVGRSDIVQMSLVRIIQGFDDFRGESSGEFRNWLKTIVSNEVHRARRTFHAEKRDVKRERTIDSDNSRMQPNTPVDVQLTPSSQSIAAEKVEKFHETLALISNDYAEVIRLRNIERLSFREIGEIMNRSEDAASKLWYRAIVQFEEKLRASGNFDSQQH